MGASTVFFAGRTTAVPGSYTEVDASGLEQVLLGATGIVAILGEAEGGKPMSEISLVKDLVRIKKPEAGRKTYKSGDLREAIDMVFAPGSDPQIPSGAVEVVSCKINPSTASTATFANAQGDAMEVSSEDYGAFTEQVNVQIADGTTKGKQLTITYEDTVEAVDDLGGDSMFRLQYRGGASGWDTMIGQILSGGVLQCLGTRDEGGLDGDVTTPLAAPGIVEAVSSDAGDTMNITIWGLDGSGDPVKETKALTGTTPVDFASYSAVYGCQLSSAAAGTVLVRADGGGATIFSLAPAALLGGVKLGEYMFVANTTVDVVADGATTQDVILEGLSAAGAVQREKITLTGAVAVTSSGSYSMITALILGDVEAARTVTVSGTALQTTPAVQNTLLKVRDYVNAKQTYIDPDTYGFNLTLDTGRLTFDPANLDVMVSATSILYTANPEFYADLYLIVEWINDNSALITAEVSTGASGGAPTNTAQPVFLAGGSEGTSLATHWQDALDLLKKTRVNSVVVLTGDPAIHAKLAAHVAYMNGAGRNERDGFAGAMNTALTDVPTKDEYKSQVVDINAAGMRLCGQAIERYNIDGERTEFMPPFAAVIAAGMQAGSPVGTSLTFKYANVLDFRGDSTWDPDDDTDEMIQAGCLFLQNVEGLGRRWVRNVTTHLTTSNVAFTEGSVYEVVLYATYNWRTNLEWAVGRKGFAGTINSTKSIGKKTANLLVDNEILVTWRSLDAELVVDTMEVSIEMAPIIPVNFVLSTIHLVTVRQSAA